MKERSKRIKLGVAVYNAFYPWTLFDIPRSRFFSACEDNTSSIIPSLNRRILNMQLFAKIQFFAIAVAAFSGTLSSAAVLEKRCANVGSVCLLDGDCCSLLGIVPSQCIGLICV
ncbi:uncharacterized protein STEHIDRAFT_118271 [Stereum hirsutum FP-91666 SS1]|uniref:uncharacterized protein n=1 Tax=Stereum hirsutum (strain FP-91666) TaxID=721885 RepID=UPI000440A10A|nr:uncharacterized protein STEHIDRAFT_118271 [Stereum hirsutum FP-91666 SS1]EIM91121.1 hypothetical protein STEHIDRAFT_118271 [Stereum hirsutum FP-91666 SS1]